MRTGELGMSSIALLVLGMLMSSVHAGPASTPTKSPARSPAPAPAPTPTYTTASAEFVTFMKGWSNNVLLINGGRCLGLDANGQVALGDCKGSRKMSVSLLDMGGYTSLNFGGQCVDVSSGKPTGSSLACTGKPSQPLVLRPAADGSGVVISYVTQASEAPFCLEVTTTGAVQAVQTCDLSDKDQIFQICKNANQCASLGPALAAERAKKGGPKPDGKPKTTPCKKFFKAMNAPGQAKKFAYAKANKVKRVSIDAAALRDCSYLGLTLPDGTTEVTLNVKKLPVEDAADPLMTVARQCVTRRVDEETGSVVDVSDEDCQETTPVASNLWQGVVDGEDTSSVTIAENAGFWAMRMSSAQHGNIIMESDETEGEGHLYEQDDEALAADSRDPGQWSRPSDRIRDTTAGTVNPGGRTLPAAAVSTTDGANAEAPARRRLAQSTTPAWDLHRYVYLNVYYVATAFTSGLRAATDMSIASINDALARANVQFRLKLLVFEEVPLTYLRPNTSSIDVTQTFNFFRANRPRSAALFGADLVTLVVPNLAGGPAGTGNIPGAVDMNWVLGGPSNTYTGAATVVKASQVYSLTFAHNIGHNFGLPHNREEPSTSNATYLFRNTSFAPRVVVPYHCQVYTFMCLEEHFAQGAYSIMSMSTPCNTLSYKPCTPLNEWGNFNGAQAQNVTVANIAISGDPTGTIFKHSHWGFLGDANNNPGRAMQDASLAIRNYARHGCGWWNATYMPFAQQIFCISGLDYNVCSSYCQGNGNYTGSPYGALFSETCSGVEWYASSNRCCFKARRTGYLDWLEYAENTGNATMWPWGTPYGKLRC